MPKPGHLWYQIVLNTHNSWLPGDRRGFRNLKGRIESTGDYRNPPPPDEHAGLRKYHQQRSGAMVRIPRQLQSAVCLKILDKIRAQQHRVLVVSVDAVHVHILAELPADRSQVKKIVGTWKQASSHAVRDQLPGRVWSARSDPEPMNDQQHQRNTFNYIVRHANAGAFIWRYDAQS